MNQPRFLIVRPDRIGDVVLSTPIPRALKKKYPNCFIAMLIRSYTQELFLNNPYVDETILIDDRMHSIGPWRSAGGIGILHTSASQSIGELKTLLKSD